MKNLEYSPEALSKLKSIKAETTGKYGADLANKIMIKMVKSIRNLQVFEESGTSISDIVGVECDYRYLYTEKNYVFYRIEGEFVKIVNILNEKQDFMWSLFGIRTTSEDTEEYWNE